MRFPGMNAIFHDPAAVEERLSRRNHGKRPAPSRPGKGPERVAMQGAEQGRGPEGSMITVVIPTVGRDSPRAVPSTRCPRPRPRTCLGEPAAGDRRR